MICSGLCKCVGDIKGSAKQTMLMTRAVSGSLQGAQRVLLGYSYKVLHIPSVLIQIRVQGERCQHCFLICCNYVSHNGGKILLLQNIISISRRCPVNVGARVHICSAYGTRRRLDV